MSKWPSADPTHLKFVPKHKELFESSFGEQEKSAWHLAMLCVHADYQGKGIARKLTTPAMQQVRSASPIFVQESNSEVCIGYIAGQEHDAGYPKS